MAFHQSKSGENMLRKPVDEFTVDFLRQKWKNSNDDCIFVSPFGIMIAHTMLLEGACGETANQIMSVLRLSPTFDCVEKMRKEFCELIQWSNLVDDHVTLKMANKLVIGQKVSVQPSYEQILKEHYSAFVDRENFEKGEDLMNTLNNWAAQETNNLIPKLFDSPINGDIVSILINVIYFKGLWLVPFHEIDTMDNIFNNFDGTKSTVKMMEKQNAKFAFCHLKDENLKIIELPYKNSISMFIIMPTMINGLDSFVSDLSAEKMDYYISSIGLHQLTTVKVPKFKIQDTHDLVDILSKMGLKLPFEDENEIINITQFPLTVSKSVQKSAIVVDEKGAEAAAATYVLKAPGCASFSRNIPTDTFVLDRPFVFLLRNRKSINLFAGVVKKLLDSQ